MTRPQEIVLDIRPALIAQQEALEDERSFRRALIVILKHERNAVRVAERLGVHRQRLYEGIKGKWMPDDPVIKELVKQWSERIKGLSPPPPSDS